MTDRIVDIVPRKAAIVSGGAILIKAAAAVFATDVTIRAVQTSRRPRWSSVVAG